AQVKIADKSLPLIATSATAGQINAQLPFDLPVDQILAIEVQRGNELSVPQPFAIVAAQPGIFTVNQTGAGQGVIVKSDQVTIANRTTPAARGEFVVIYCTGLGAVDQAIELGKPAPSNPPARTKATPVVTIGGKPATVVFSGLTPGF